MRKRVILALCALVMALAMLPVRALAEEPEVYVALGDSTTSGYGLASAETEAFPALVAAERGYELVNLSSDEGVTSAAVLEQLADPAVLAEVQRADVITLTAGGNDLLGALYAFLAEQYAAANPGVALTPEQIIAALTADEPDLALVTALMGYVPQFGASSQAVQALEDFGANLHKIAAAVSAANPDATLLVLSQFNPYGRINNPLATEFVTAFEAAAYNLNAVIAAGAQTGAYAMVDCTAALAAVEESPFNAYFTSVADFNLDFHLNASGHKAVASTVCGALDLAAPDPEPTPDPEPGTGFTDVAEDAWYYDAVQSVASAGIMTGLGEGVFGPGELVSRAQIATILWRLAGEPEATTELLPDCGADEFYSAAVSWALENEIMTGYEDGTFGPADALTREQAATVLWRAEGSPEVEADLSAYPDADDVSEFAQAAMNWAVSSGVISGQGNGALDPQGTCARANIAMILMRMSSGE